MTDLVIGTIIHSFSMLLFLFSEMHKTVQFNEVESLS